MGFREDEAKALEAAKEAARQRKADALAKGQTSKKSPQQKRDAAARKLAAAKKRSAAALAKLREAANQSIERPEGPKGDTSKQRARIDERLREIQGLNQNTDSNN